MQSKIKIIILILFITILSCSKPHKSFSVLIQELPDRIHPYDAGIDYKLYVLKQLFEPLFVYKNDHSFHSNLLSSWKSLNNHQTYRLCLKPDIKFSNNEQLTLSGLKVNLVRLQNKGIISTKIASFDMAGNCLTVNFNKPYIRFPFNMSSL